MTGLLPSMLLNRPHSLALPSCVFHMQNMKHRGNTSRGIRVVAETGHILTEIAFSSGTPAPSSGTPAPSSGTPPPALGLRPQLWTLQTRPLSPLLDVAPECGHIMQFCSCKVNNITLIFLNSLIVLVSKQNFYVIIMCAFLQGFLTRQHF